MIFAVVFCDRLISAEPAQQPQNSVQGVNHAFAPGEKLTYSISWSKILKAGVAVMEVKDGLSTDGRPVFRLVSSTHTVGLVDAIYPVSDVAESIVDVDEIYSLSFRIKESHRDQKRRREIIFDYKNKTARFQKDDDPLEIIPMQGRIQDALSSLYYARTRQDFIVGKPIVVDVLDGGKVWSVEVQTLGKERVKTPAGEFDTVKVKTYPKYEGVFMHKGEIYIWLTDDSRKIPVLMKSIISIGSIVATLTEIQGGNNKP